MVRKIAYTFDFAKISFERFWEWMKTKKKYVFFIMLMILVIPLIIESFK